MAGFPATATRLRDAPRCLVGKLVSSDGDGVRDSLGPQFNPVRPGGWFVWTDPEVVKDADLRYGRDAEILRVSTAPSTYRLLSPSELPAIIETLKETLPPHFPQPVRQCVRMGVCAS